MGKVPRAISHYLTVIIICFAHGVNGYLLITLIISSRLLKDSPNVAPAYGQKKLIRCYYPASVVQLLRTSSIMRVVRSSSPDWSDFFFFIIHSPFALRNGPLFSKILLSFWKQLYFKMAGIHIKICRQTGPYGRVPQWFDSNCECSIINNNIGLTCLWILLVNAEGNLTPTQLDPNRKSQSIPVFTFSQIYYWYQKSILNRNEA